MTTLIIFNGVYYSQVDGVAMGSPLGPTLANLFLAYHEEKWLNDRLHSTQRWELNIEQSLRPLWVAGQAGR